MISDLRTKTSCENPSCAKRSRATAASRTRTLVQIGLFAAQMAILAQISIPLPSGVPITLQTFAIMFAGFFLGWKAGLYATLIYIALGAIGMPVFASFTGGFGKLIGITGGFIWGFIPLVLLSGAGAKNLGTAANLSLAGMGVLVLHVLGIAQYCLVAHSGVVQGLALVSAPYIVKDLVSMALAYYFAQAIGKRLRYNNIQ